MGQILYGAHEYAVVVDDRVLAHLKMVMVTKLRRHESFLLSWERLVEAGSGRESLWIHPAIPLRFQFVGSRRPTLNRVWMDLLLESAGQGELRILPEPPSPS